MTKKERAQVWRSRIRRLSDARRSFFEGERDAEGNVVRPGANFAVEAYRGNTKPPWWNCEDPWVHVGKVKSAIRANLPALLYSNPEFRVYPAAVDVEAGQDVAYARSRAKEAWVNHIWREGNGNTHARYAIQNAFCSYGVVKVGYRCDFEDDSKRGVFARDDEGDYVLDENGDPTLERGEFLLDENGDIELDSYGVPVLHPGTTCKEEFLIEVTDPEMMLFDIESGPDFKQHRFVIEEWVRPLEEVKDDPRFPSARRKRLTASEGVGGVSANRSTVFKSHLDDVESSAVSSDESRLRGWDIYDFQNGRYMVLPDCSDADDEFLYDGPMPAGMDHGPFCFLKLTEDMGYGWYPIPDAIDMARLAQEYDITRSEMMIHREHTKTRYMELPNAYDGHPGVDPEEEREKWAHGPDGTCIKVNNANAIVPAPKANLDSSFMAAIPNIAMDFNEVSGLPGETRGLADAETATQASIMATGTEVRNNDRRDNLVQAFLCEIARKLLISGQANADLDTLVIEKVRERTGGVAPFKARRIAPNELLGEFEVTISVGSTLPKNDPRVMNSLMNLLNALAQNPALGQFRGLIRRVIDGLGLDPILADEIYDISVGITQQQMAGPKGSPEGPPSNTGQVLQDLLGGVGNAAGGAQTGAPSTARGYQ